MININAQIIFFYVKKSSIAITILFHMSYQCAIMPVITLNITIHGSNYNGLQRHFIA